MINEFKKILKENYDIDNITMDTNFKTDLGLTSFDFVNLIAIIEDKFGVEIEEEEYRSIDTISDLIGYLESKNVSYR